MDRNTPSRATRVSVVVPCRNEARSLPAFLESLLKQELEGLDAEFLIADGMSDDGSRAILESYRQRDPRIRIIDNPERIVSTGLNAAIRAASGEVIIRMDVHTVFAPDYMKACVRILQETGADNVGGPARTTAAGLMQRAVAAAYHSPFSTGGARFHQVDFEGPVDTVTYGCWYKTTLERLGLFDEALVRNQDDELNLRILRSGGTIWQSPEIRSLYHPRARLSQLFRQYFQYGFWKIAVIRKHRIPASLRHLVPVLFVVSLVGLASLAIGASIVGTAATARFSLWTLGLELAAYALGALYFSWRSARVYGWDLFPLLPVVFATYHFSYGLGCLTGLAKLWRAPEHGPRLSAAFTNLSR